MACRQACWAGSACRQRRGHALCPDGRLLHCWRVEPVPAYFAFQVRHGQRSCWMSPCLPSRLFVLIQAWSWKHFQLCFLFRCSHSPLVSACDSCRSLLIVGNFPGCHCSVRSCPRTSFAGYRALAIPHACLGSYLHVRFDCCSSDPPGLFFPITCGRSSGGLPISGSNVR